MTNFDDIRPYRDDEVRPTLDRLLADQELTDAVTRLKFPKLHGWLGWMLKPLVRNRLTQQLAGIQDVQGFQAVVERYMAGMISSTAPTSSPISINSLPIPPIMIPTGCTG